MAGPSHWFPPAPVSPLPADGAALDLAVRIARLPVPLRPMLENLVTEIERGLLRGAPPAGSA